MCPKPNDTHTELSKTSYVEELADGVPGLFTALTSDIDPQERWLSITYPVDIDLSAYRPAPEKQLVYHLRKYSLCSFFCFFSSCDQFGDYKQMC